ncbi:phosphotransferase family enzyme [Lentzea flaviverrucosa]|uniref:Phosphotransferase enzyme family protein n=2 Tax=Lentzea flaviverrucosa TaxID=200379 RepID=A0A1H9H5I9_9PSEU|nr:phosphotransferase family enzyme [Lentzea flaviverrucosa]SEQ57604.1 Phosphotransferase enzyme family protein [Lentzea flaviverrucosa]
MAEERRPVRPAPSGTRHTVPGALLADLRGARHSHPGELAAVLASWSLRPLTGGRNNDVYAWDGICVKLYRRTDRNRVEREWHGLRHVAELGVAPRPLWFDEHPSRPALGMTLVPGSPADEGVFPPALLTDLAGATRAMQALPLTEPLAAMARVDSIARYVARLTDEWPVQLSEAPGDEHTPQMLTLLRRWRAGNDACLLAQPAPKVFSRGDANLLNWLHHHTGLHVVDFEFAGFSDPAVDAADHVEHISACHVPDACWFPLTEAFGDRDRARFDAARRTIALRWLAVLWKQRGHRPHEFLRQLDRVRTLLA